MSSYSIVCSRSKPVACAIASWALARTSVSSSTGRSSSKKSPVASGSAIQTYSRTTRASSGNARVRVRHVVQAAHQRRDVDRGVRQRERLGAADEVAVVGIELAGARSTDTSTPIASAPARGERAHERAVAAADVDDEAALEFDGVRELLEVGHAVQRRLPRVRRPLDDVRVLAIEQFGAGPWATLQLADLGAEVIKIEDPASGGDVGRYVPPYRDGRGLAVLRDLQPRQAQRVAGPALGAPAARSSRTSCGVSDAVYSNLRGDQPAKLRITYDDLRELNPRIVCCSLSGFGTTGPRRAEPAYDYVLQALTGWMSLTGEPDGPPVKSGLSLVDFSRRLRQRAGAAGGRLARAPRRRRLRLRHVAVRDRALAADLRRARGRPRAGT